MKKLYAAVLASAVAAPAFAGTLDAPLTEAPILQPMPPAPIAMRHDWTGGYVGGQLGFGELSQGISGNGVIGGVHAGYNYGFGNWVAGAEVSYDRARMNLDGGGRIEELLRFKLRAGPTFGNTFAYGTVGLASARADAEGFPTIDGRDNGWLAGLGAEVAVGGNWSVGGEVVHHRFNDFGGSGDDVGTTTAQARVSFRF